MILQVFPRLGGAGWVRVCEKHQSNRSRETCTECEIKTEYDEVGKWL